MKRLVLAGAAAAILSLGTAGVAAAATTGGQPNGGYPGNDHHQRNQCTVIELTGHGFLPGDQKQKEPDPYSQPSDNPTYGSPVGAPSSAPVYSSPAQPIWVQGDRERVTAEQWVRVCERQQEEYGNQGYGWYDMPGDGTVTVIDVTRPFAQEAEAQDYVSPSPDNQVLPTPSGHYGLHS